jgi:microcystin-dependent protein
LPKRQISVIIISYKQTNKGKSMFTFACGSVEGLTLNQKRETLAALKISIKQDITERKFARMLNAEAKRHAVVTKREQAIARAEARLAKLLAKQVGAVGAKALKANRKPSKVVTYGAEANEIAAAIMAKKQSA